MSDPNDPPFETDAIWQRAEIDSPCIKICVLHPGAGLCMGCYRSAEEIRRWSRYTPEERTEIMMTLQARAPLVERAAPVHREGRRRNRRFRMPDA